MTDIFRSGVAASQQMNLYYSICTDMTKNHQRLCSTGERPPTWACSWSSNCCCQCGLGTGWCLRTEVARRPSARAHQGGPPPRPPCPSGCSALWQACPEKRWWRWDSAQTPNLWLREGRSRIRGYFFCQWEYIQNTFTTWFTAKKHKTLFYNSKLSY